MSCCNEIFAYFAAQDACYVHDLIDELLQFIQRSENSSNVEDKRNILPIYSLVSLYFSIGDYPSSLQYCRQLVRMSKDDHAIYFRCCLLACEVSLASSQDQNELFLEVYESLASVLESSFPRCGVSPTPLNFSDCTSYKAPPQESSNQLDIERYLMICLHFKLQLYGARYFAHSGKLSNAEAKLMLASRIFQDYLQPIYERKFFVDSCESSRMVDYLSALFCSVVTKDSTKLILHSEKHLLRQYFYVQLLKVRMKMLYLPTCNFHYFLQARLHYENGDYDIAEQTLHDCCTLSLGQHDECLAQYNSVIVLLRMKNLQTAQISLTKCFRSFCSDTMGYQMGNFFLAKLLSSNSVYRGFLPNLAVTTRAIYIQGLVFLNRNEPIKAYKCLSLCQYFQPLAVLSKIRMAECCILHASDCTKIANSKIKYQIISKKNSKRMLFRYIFPDYKFVAANE